MKIIKKSSTPEIFQELFLDLYVYQCFRTLDWCFVHLLSGSFFLFVVFLYHFFLLLQTKIKSVPVYNLVSELFLDLFLPVLLKTMLVLLRPSVFRSENFPFAETWHRTVWIKRAFLLLTRKTGNFKPIFLLFLQLFVWIETDVLDLASLNVWGSVWFLEWVWISAHIIILLFSVYNTLQYLKFHECIFLSLSISLWRMMKKQIRMGKYQLKHCIILFLFVSILLRCFCSNQIVRWIQSKNFIQFSVRRRVIIILLCFYSMLYALSFYHDEIFLIDL